MKERISIARIVKAHGLRGEIKTAPLTSDVSILEIYNELDRVYITIGSVDKEYEIESVKFQPKGAILKLTGIDTVDDANVLRDTIICVPREAFGEIDEDELFVEDIIGFKVEGRNGVDYGVIESHFETKASDIFVIRTKDGEAVNLPFISDVFDMVDYENQTVYLINEDGYFE